MNTDRLTYSSVFWWIGLFIQLQLGLHIFCWISDADLDAASDSTWKERKSEGKFNNLPMKERSKYVKKMIKNVKIKRQSIWAFSVKAVQKIYDLVKHS